MSKADSIFVWHIFHILPSDPSKMKCKIWNVELSRGGKTSKTLNTTNLPKHILCKHGEEYKIEQSLKVTERGNLSNRNYRGFYVIILSTQWMNIMNLKRINEYKP